MFFVKLYDQFVQLRSANGDPVGTKAVEKSLEKVFDFFEWILLSLEEKHYRSACYAAQSAMMHACKNPEKDQPHIIAEGINNYREFLVEMKSYFKHLGSSKKALKAALLPGFKHYE